MATYARICDKAHNVDFQNRVETAIVAAAIAISAEADTVTNHANRAAWAKQVLHGPLRASQVMAMGVATDAAVQADATDEAIYNAVAGQWNAYAGVIP